MKILITLSASPKYKKGDRVIANYGTTKVPEYWSGTVTALRAGMVHILFDDGTKDSFKPTRSKIGLVGLTDRKAKRKTQIPTADIDKWLVVDLGKATPPRKRGTPKAKPKVGSEGTDEDKASNALQSIVKEIMRKTVKGFTRTKTEEMLSTSGKYLELDITFKPKNPRFKDIFTTVVTVFAPISLNGLRPAGLRNASYRGVTTYIPSNKQNIVEQHGEFFYKYESLKNVHETITLYLHKHLDDLRFKGFVVEDYQKKRQHIPSRKKRK